MSDNIDLSQQVDCMDYMDWVDWEAFHLADLDLDVADW